MGGRARASRLSVSHCAARRVGWRSSRGGHWRHSKCSLIDQAAKRSSVSVAAQSLPSGAAGLALDEPLVDELMPPAAIWSVIANTSPIERGAALRPRRISRRKSRPSIPGGIPSCCPPTDSTGEPSISSARTLRWLGVDGQAADWKAHPRCLESLAGNNQPPATGEN
jgi:hypothetical protein